MKIDEHKPCDLRAAKNVQFLEIVGCFLQVLQTAITVQECRSVKAITNDIGKILGHVQYQESTPQTMLVTEETICTKSCMNVHTYVLYVCTYMYTLLCNDTIHQIMYVTCITAAKVMSNLLLIIVFCVQPLYTLQVCTIN